MLTIEKSYCISSDDDDDRYSTVIRLNKKDGFYNFAVINHHGDKIEFQLNETLTGELFTTLKELGNFM